MGIPGLEAGPPDIFRSFRMNEIVQPKIGHVRFGMGAPVLRKEDNAFITGKGRYTDDIAPDRALQKTIVVRFD